MNLAYKSKAKAFFVDIDSPNYEKDEKLNIILSPALYWVKRVTLPVKYLRDVKGLIPSLFEEVLPEGKYTYSAYKDGDEFLLFAYNDKELLDLIAEKGVSASNINNVYLAQSEFDKIESPIQITDESVLAVQNGVVVKLPISLVSESKALELDSHKFSNRGIHLTRFNQIADKKSQVVFASILGLLIVIFLAEWLITSSKVNTIIEKQSEVYANHHLPSTNFQNEAIHAKLNTTFERQSRIRGIFNLILTIKLKSEERLEQISLEKRKVVVVIKTASKIRGDKAFSKVVKTFKRTKARFDNGTYVLEIQL